MGFTPGDTRNGNSNEVTNSNENNHETKNKNEKARNSHYGNSRKPTLQIEGEEKGFLGKTKELEGVLGLRTERLSHKVSFDSFRETLGEFVVKTFNGARHIISLIEEMEDPMAEFVRENKPRVKRKRETSDETSTKKVKAEGEGESHIDDPNDTPDDESEDDHVYYDPDDYVEKMMLDTKIKAFVAQEEQLKNNINKVYAVVWGQCTSSLQAVLKGNGDFELKHKKRDVLWLFGQIKIVTAGIDTKSNRYKNLQTALMHLLTMRQGEIESNDKFLTRFKSNVQTVELAGGRQYLVPIKWIGEFHTNTEFEDEREKFLAMLFLCRCDLKRYSGVMERLQQQMNLGIDQYPVTIALTFDLLVRESGSIVPSNSNYRSNDGYSRKRAMSKFMFLQVKHGCKVIKNKDDLVASVNGSYHADITCYNCNNKGHYSNECPYEYANKQNGVNLLMRAITLTQNDPTLCEINPDWILLDTCSTASVAGNPQLVTNIRDCDEEQELYISTNGGSMKYNQVADLNMFPIPVHYNPDSIATILALKDIASVPGCYLTMDTRKAREITVSFEDDRSTFVFKECRDGLYFFDTAVDSQDNFDSKKSLNPYMFLQTVESNKSFFSNKDIAKADDARTLQQRLGFPGTSTLMSYLRKNFLSNTSVTVDDVKRGDIVYGPMPQLLKGKFVDNKQLYIPPPNPASVHPLILEQCLNLSLFVDYFYVNGLCFLLTHTDKLGFLTATLCERTGGAEAIRALEHVVDIHSRRGFAITNIHGDNEFNSKKLHQGLPDLFFASCAAEEHVPQAERPIRTIKERSRCITHDVPFTIFPKILTKELILFVIERLNDFPSKGTLSDSESPNTHVLGHPRPDISLPFVSFGSYCLVYMGTDNTQKARAVPAIVLRPSNLSGGFYFMSLYSGKRLHAYRWKELPIDKDVIDRVHELGTHDAQPANVHSELLFEWQPGLPLDEDQGAAFAPNTHESYTDPPPAPAPLTESTNYDITNADNLNTSIEVSVNEPINNETELEPTHYETEIESINHETEIAAAYEPLHENENENTEHELEREPNN